MKWAHQEQKMPYLLALRIFWLLRLSRQHFTFLDGGFIGHSPQALPCPLGRMVFQEQNMLTPLHSGGVKAAHTWGPTLLTKLMAYFGVHLLCSQQRLRRSCRAP